MTPEEHDNRESTETEAQQQPLPPAPSSGENDEGETEKDSSFSLQEMSGGQSGEGDEDEYAMENEEWGNDSSDKCNLIVNYLPHEIDDVALKVPSVLPVIPYRLLTNPN